MHVSGRGVYHFRRGGVHCFWLRNGLFQAVECMFPAGEWIISCRGVHCDGSGSASVVFKLETAFF